MFDIKVKETSLPLSDWNIDLKSGLVCTQRTHTTDSGSRLVDPVDDEDVEEIVHELILQLWQCDLKKMKEY
jgi:hypothetical protein